MRVIRSMPDNRCNTDNIGDDDADDIDITKDRPAIIAIETESRPIPVMEGMNRFASDQPMTCTSSTASDMLSSTPLLPFSYVPCQERRVNKNIKVKFAKRKQGLATVVGEVPSLSTLSPDDHQALYWTASEFLAVRTAAKLATKEYRTRAYAKQAVERLESLHDLLLQHTGHWNDLPDLAEVDEGDEEVEVERKMESSRTFRGSKKMNEDDFNNFLEDPIEFCTVNEYDSTLESIESSAYGWCLRENTGRGLERYVSNVLRANRGGAAKEARDVVLGWMKWKKQSKVNEENDDALIQASTLVEVDDDGDADKDDELNDDISSTSDISLSSDDKLAMIYHEYNKGSILYARCMAVADEVAALAVYDEDESSFESISDENVEGLLSGTCNSPQTITSQRSTINEAPTPTKSRTVNRKKSSLSLLLNDRNENLPSDQTELTPSKTTPSRSRSDSSITTASTTGSRSSYDSSDMSISVGSINQSDHHHHDLISIPESPIKLRRTKPTSMASSPSKFSAEDGSRRHRLNRGTVAKPVLMPLSSSSTPLIESPTRLPKQLWVSQQDPSCQPPSKAVQKSTSSSQSTPFRTTNAVSAKTIVESTKEESAIAPESTDTIDRREMMKQHKQTPQQKSYRQTLAGSGVVKNRRAMFEHANSSTNATVVTGSHQYQQRSRRRLVRQSTHQSSMSSKMKSTNRTSGEISAHVAATASSSSSSSSPSS
jgi:hypothetical protein